MTPGIRAWLLVGASIACLAAGHAGADVPPNRESFRQWGHLSDDWGGTRSRLEERGLHFDVAYTGDFVDNTIGGFDTGAVYLGNLDVTFTLHSWELLPVDLGTLFVYGLVDHGGRPSALVGDLQVTDNIEAPSTAKLYELWWQHAFLEGRVSLLAGLYDVNSEFYVADSAQIFLNSSFGIGPELSLTGGNGPSIFPNTSLAFRVGAEPVPGYEINAAVMDGVPADPNDPSGTQIEFNPGDGIFFIAEIARYWSREGVTPPRPGEAHRGPVQRRRVGRTIDRAPYFLSLKLGTWLYSAEQPDLTAIAATGRNATQPGHPGVYLIVEYDATRFSPLAHGQLATFLQLGYADGDVAPFAGYTGAGMVYTGLIPTRPDDALGLGIAAAYAGNGLDATNLADGGVPATAEIALEFTYRLYPVRWLSVQTDLQYVIHPSALRSRPNALVLAFRYVIDF